MDIDLSEAKIVFLDIDGCLTSVEDGTSFLLLKPESYSISSGRFSLLKRMLEDNDAYVVISSNWRRFPDDGYWNAGEGLFFKNHLPMLKEMLGGRYIGDLPHDRHISKSEALELWGEYNDVDFDSLHYVIIEDDDREGFGLHPRFRHHYVKCDPYTGLTVGNCMEAESVLNDEIRQDDVYHD